MTCRAGSLAVVVDIPTAIHVSDEAGLVVYRVAQESLTNVARHAGASHVQVVVQERADALQLQVSDNGSGAATSTW